MLRCGPPGLQGPLGGALAHCRPAGWPFPPQLAWFLRLPCPPAGPSSHLTPAFPPVLLCPAPLLPWWKRACPFIHSRAKAKLWYLTKLSRSPLLKRKLGKALRLDPPRGLFLGAALLSVLGSGAPACPPAHPALCCSKCKGNFRTSKCRQQSGCSSRHVCVKDPL